MKWFYTFVRIRIYNYDGSIYTTSINFQKSSINQKYSTMKWFCTLVCVMGRVIDCVCFCLGLVLLVGREVLLQLEGPVHREVCSVSRPQPWLSVRGRRPTPDWVGSCWLPPTLSPEAASQLEGREAHDIINTTIENCNNTGNYVQYAYSFESS